jgi:hypothetical protein
MLSRPFVPRARKGLRLRLALSLLCKGGDSRRRAPPSAPRRLPVQTAAHEEEFHPDEGNSPVLLGAACVVLFIKSNQQAAHEI